jgi:hypothetical protein
MLTLLGGFQYSDAALEHGLATVGRMRERPPIRLPRVLRDALPFARRRYGVEREAELSMLRHEISMLRRGIASPRPR